MKRTPKISARKLVKSSIDFISLRLLTVNNLCRELPASSKNQTGKKALGPRSHQTFPTRTFERGLGPRADADVSWNAAACFGEARMLLRWYGAPTRCRRCEGRRRGCGNQPRSEISPSRPPPPPTPSSWRGWHRHAFPTQKPSPAPGLRCPLLAREGFSRLALFSLRLTSLFCVRAPGVDAGLRWGCGPPPAAVWPRCWQSLVDRSWWLMSRLGANSCWFDYYCFIS